MSFTIQVPCKSYSRHFLELKFGTPVNLQKDKLLYKQLALCLEKNSDRYKKRYEALSFSNYTDIATILIKRPDFYKLGWDLTRTEIVEFNQAIELKAKSFMHSFIAPRVALGFSWTETILLFQEEYGFTEDIWTHEAIRKECQRNLNIDRGELFKDILINININV